MHGKVGGAEGGDPLRRKAKGVQPERLRSLESFHHRCKLEEGRNRIHNIDRYIFHINGVENVASTDIQTPKKGKKRSIDSCIPGIPHEMLYVRL